MTDEIAIFIHKSPRFKIANPQNKIFAKQAWRGLAVLAVTLLSALATPGSAVRAAVRATNAINFRAISSGGHAMHNRCYRLSGTLGQVAPGYSSGVNASAMAGFGGAAMPSSMTDEIFFDTLEGC